MFGSGSMAKIFCLEEPEVSAHCKGGSVSLMVHSAGCLTVCMYIKGLLSEHYDDWYYVFLETHCNS